MSYLFCNRTSLTRRKHAIILEELRERLGLTMLFITHDLRVAAQICDRVAVMHEGAISGVLPRDRLSEQTIMQLATGGSIH